MPPPTQDHDGKQFEDTHLLGQYALLSFGSATDDKEGAQRALRHMHDLSDRVGMWDCWCGYVCDCVAMG